MSQSLHEQDTRKCDLPESEPNIPVTHNPRKCITASDAESSTVSHKEVFVSQGNIKMSHWAAPQERERERESGRWMSQVEVTIMVHCPLPVELVTWFTLFCSPLAHLSLSFSLLFTFPLLSS